MNQVENKGRAIALLPIGVFLVIFLGSGIVTGFLCDACNRSFFDRVGSSVYAEQTVVIC